MCCGGGDNLEDEEREKLANVKGGLWFGRAVAGIVMGSLNIILGITSEASLGADYGYLINDGGDTSCALKVAVGSFAVVIVVHAGVVLLECFYTCYLTKKRGCCDCECYTVKTFAHIACCLLLIMSVCIFYALEPDKVGWQIQMQIANTVIASVNGAAYIVMLLFEKNMWRQGVDVERMKRGSKLD